MKKIRLWDGEIPQWNEEYGQEQPSITPYLFDTDEPLPAVVVCPGGGYEMRAPHEGAPVAKFFNECGFQAFVLNYRVKPYKQPAALLDLQRAIKYIRTYAEEFQILPDKVAVLGFSAGGHLAGSSLVMENLTPEGDEIDQVDPKPNAGILCYPVITMDPSFTHLGSQGNLLGENADQELIDRWSLEKRVTRDTPPCFLWHTADDEAVSSKNSLEFALALREHDVPYSLHIFPSGRHGLGLGDEVPYVEIWKDLAAGWLYETFECEE